MFEVLKVHFSSVHKAVCFICRMSCDLFVFETWCTDILHIYWN